MENNVELLNTRLLDLFTIDELAKVTMLEWKHEGRQIEDDLAPFFSDEEIGEVRGGYDPGTLWNSIVSHECHGDVIVELYDPAGNQIYDAHERLKRELEAFEEMVEGYGP
ncbi:hypothetical protein [Rhizobium sp. MHM7A]|uniref:hypothetical protein n=1 Tax=Rhizobium sp. MHM7A TaxID=2583233 RepID=UPI001105C339|nr:hypothetical protein [Rhizobium sp. MHM7A]TLX16416.1 hypothetical protein FFR93_03525 [Rhizobium sp. MHM7A]